GPNGKVSDLGDQMDRGCAADSTRRPVEHREKAVTCGLDLVASEPVELEPDAIVVLPQELLPCRIAHARCDGCGIDDVGDEQGRDDPLTAIGWLAEAPDPCELDGD